MSSPTDKASNIILFKPNNGAREVRTVPLIPPASKANWVDMARQAEFKVARLARLSGVPLRTLQRHFQKHHKMAVTEWMREVRLGEARIMLLAGGRIKEVAYDLGFKQLSHFSRAFKKQFGIAPSLLAQPCEQSKITAGEFRDSMLDAGSRPR